MRCLHARTRLLCVIAAFIGAATLLTACGTATDGSSSGGSGSSQGSGAAVTPPSHSVHATITLWTLSLSTFSSYIKGEIADFNKEYPNVKVNWVDVPGTDIQDKYIASFAAGQAPNLVNLSFSSLTQDQQDFLDWKNYLTSAQLDNFITALRQTMTVNGKQLAIPFYGSVADYPVIYNVTLLKKAGISTLPTTIAQEYADGVKLHKADPNAYWTIGGESPVTGGTAAAELMGEGVPLLSSDLKKAVFDSPKAIALLTRDKKAWDQGVFYPESANQSAQNEADALFIEGAVATWGGGITGQVGAQMQSLQGHLAVGPDILGGLGKYQVQPGQFWALSKNQSGTDAYLSAQLAMVFESNSSELAFFKATDDRIGANTYSALNLPTFKALPPTTQPIVRGYQQYENQSINLAVPYSPTLKGSIPVWPEQTQIEQDLQTQWDEAIQGSESPSQALATAQQQANSLLATASSSS